uniref:Spectrin alpha chain, non-erythrocytic 1 n=1 Tax=Sphaerodactylus townsendi TaxID=933632 RepID=A0ACB8FQ70_9SAUR
MVPCSSRVQLTFPDDSRIHELTEEEDDLLGATALPTRIPEPTSAQKAAQWKAQMEGLKRTQPQWHQLDQFGMRMQHNLEQQIQARNTTGVTEEVLKEFSMMFKHFNKNKSRWLNHQEFKSCLRSLGCNFLMVEEGEPDPEFEAILDTVDPNRDGHVSLQEYMAFMISRETQNVKSNEEIGSASRVLSSEGKPYVSKEDLYQNLTWEQADYCISHMKSYMDSKVRELPFAYNYIEFSCSLFVN